MRRDEFTDVVGGGIRKVLALGVAVVLMAVGGVAGCNLIEVVSPDANVGIQSPLTGAITWYTTPGPKWQGFGRIHTLPKRSVYEFHAPKATDEPDRRIMVRFNDSGRGFIDGLMQFEYPSDQKSLTILLMKFGTPENIQRSLIEPTVAKSVYFAGPMMSSKESYAEKKNAFAEYVEDQVENGIYATTQVTTTTVDPLTNEKKEIAVLQIVQRNGVKMRQEKGQLTAFGIKPFGLAIRDIDYDDAVDKQIREQQGITMAVQTSKAETLKAQQMLITTQAQGEANAAQAKWAQEVEKAKAVTFAEQEREVAKLKAEAAEAYKQEQYLRADADATYKRRVMEADGALKQKLDAYIAVQQFYAAAIKDHAGPWVPSVVMGGGSASSVGAMPLIDLLTAKTAKDLGLDLTVKGGGK
jgi:hypothetical protein